MTLIVPQAAIPNTYVDGVLASSETINPFLAIGATGYSGAQVQFSTTAAATHVITSSQPIGIEVYGYFRSSSADSYGYEGGRSQPLLAAAPDMYAVPVSGGTTLDVIANDTWSNRADVVLTIVSPPTHGWASVVSGKISYNANGHLGTDQFTYQIAENGLASTAITTVLASTNLPPIAANYTNCDTSNPIIFNVLANCSDPNGYPLSVLFVEPADQAQAVLNPDNTITYTRDDPGTGSPFPLFGFEAFQYTITDGHGGVATGTVYIDDLAANVDGYGYETICATMNSPETINVLANDTNILNLPMTIVSVTQGTWGSVTINPGAANHSQAMASPLIRTASAAGTLLRTRSRTAFAPGPRRCLCRSTRSPP